MKSTDRRHWFRIRWFILISPVVLISLFCGYALADSEQSATLSLSQAIHRAVKENPMAQAAAFNIDASAARVTQARSGFFPQVSLKETYNRTNNPMWAFGTKLNQKIIGLPDFDPVQLNDPDVISNFATNLSLEWSLFDPARSWIPWQQAKQDLSATRSTATRTRQEIIARVAISYADLLLTREQLNVVRQSLETAQAHLKLVSARYKNGFVVKSDLLRAQVHIAELDQVRLQTESSLEVSRANLNAAMGASMDRRFELTSLLTQGPETTGTLDKWVATALVNRPDLKMAGYREQMAQKDVKKSKAAHLPSVSLIGDYEMNSESFTDTDDNYTLGAVMRLNLFSGNRLWAKTEETRAALGSSKAMKKALENRIRVETRQAFFQAQSAWNRIQVAKTVISQAEEGLRIVRNRYKSGLFTIVNLLDAEVTLQQSHMNHYRALHDHRVARARLALACGIIDTDFQ
jgi:outer membrane protein